MIARKDGIASSALPIVSDNFCEDLLYFEAYGEELTAATQDFCYYASCIRYTVYVLLPSFYVSRLSLACIRGQSTATMYRVTGRYACSCNECDGTV